MTINWIPLGPQLRRWAERNGKVVRWGNVIGPFLGQEFEEVFATVAQAKKRERQALACEEIGADRAPVALRRCQVGGIVRNGVQKGGTRAWYPHEVEKINEYKGKMVDKTEKRMATLYKKGVAARRKG